MIDIIHLGMTASLSANYVLDILFSVLVFVVLPVKLVSWAIEKFL